MKDPNVPKVSPNLVLSVSGTEADVEAGERIMSTTGGSSNNNNDNNDIEEKLSVQVSISSLAGQGFTMQQDWAQNRIMDGDDLVFIRTEKEKQHDDKMLKRLTTMMEDKVSCSLDEWDALIELQCPMPPRNYDYENEEGHKETVNTTARLYKDTFFIRDPNTGRIYKALTSKKDIKKHQERLDQMRAVDEYLGHFKLTSSVQIYKRFNRAVGFLEDSTKTKSERKKEETAYKLIPGWMDRLGFLTIGGRAALNAFFIGYNLRAALYYNDNLDKPFEDNYFYFLAVLITAGAEAYLWLTAFWRTLYNTWSLLKRVIRNDTVHFQTKNMPMQIREMASTSVLRFLPSGESTNRLRKRFKEWWAEIIEDYRFAVSNARKHKLTVQIRETIHIGFLLSGPILGTLALVFKIANIDLNPDNLFTFEKGFDNWLFYIITYAGFVNQIASIRKVRVIEMDALQHFVFSGNDVKLSRHERQMMNVWWNYTIVSCVANICDKFKYPVFDSIVFWHQINPRKLQILLKNHDAEGEDYLQSSIRGGKRVVDVMSQQDHDQNVKSRASTNRSEREKHANDMAEIVDSPRSIGSDDDGDIVTSNVRSQQTARQSNIDSNQLNQVPDSSDRSDVNNRAEEVQEQYRE